MSEELEIRSPKSEARRWEPRLQGAMLSGAAGNSSSLGALSRLRVLVCLLLAVATGLCLTGCFGFLKPAQSTSRHFVLTSVPTPESATAPRGAAAVGLGQIKLAAYLFNSSLAIRRGTNEVDYSNSDFWAERLDTGLQRVLAANLATLLPTDQIRLSSWQTADVSVEVYVAIDRFDVDAHGQAVLVAWWRIVSPGGEKVLKSGQSRFTRQGPQPEADAAGAVATLSELAADLSRRLAEAVTEAAPASGRPQ